MPCKLRPWRKSRDRLRWPGYNFAVVNSLFCDAAMVERIERVEREMVVKGGEVAQRRHEAAFVIPVAGGAACYAEPDSPLNKVVGLGFGGIPDTAVLDEVELAFAERGAPTQVELSHLADPEIAVLLTGRGYQLVSYENVLGRDIRGFERETPPGLEVRLSRADEFELWLDAVVDGFAHPDGQGVPSHEEFSREVIANALRGLSEAGVEQYIAMLDGVIAGGASMRVADGVAQLAGAATVPAYRRRGVQTAFMSVRLTIAAAAGCDLAVITTQPGSKSQQNAQNSGFDLLYTRAVLVK